MLTRFWKYWTTNKSSRKFLRFLIVVGLAFLGEVFDPWIVFLSFAVLLLRWEYQTEAQSRSLREGAEELRTFMELMPQIVWISLPEAKVEYFNQKWYQFTGLDPSQETGFGWADILHPDDISMVMQVFEGAQKNGTAFEAEYRLKRADGKYLWHLGRSLPLKDGSDQIVKWIGTATDIDERKRMEEQKVLLAQEQVAREEAQKANRNKDEFLATLSHELRTPLQAILTWTQMLLTGKLDAEKTKRGLETIKGSVVAQMQIIRDLLDISSIISGKFQMDFRLMYLQAVVESSVSALRPLAESAGLNLILEVEPTVGTILGDCERIQQVIWNLLTNAIKFTPAGGTIRVVVDQTDDRARLRVIDSGRGIDQQFLPRIFDKFSQEESSRKRTTGGLGLGLAIVHHLVDLHHGEVKAESPGPGLGSTFTVLIPLQVDDIRNEIQSLRPKKMRDDLKSQSSDCLG